MEMIDSREELEKIKRVVKEAAGSGKGMVNIRIDIIAPDRHMKVETLFNEVEKFPEQMQLILSCWDVLKEGNNDED